MSNAVHISLNVSDLPRSADFYRRFFGEPRKLKSDYAKFVTEDPVIHLALMPGPVRIGNGALSPRDPRRDLRRGARLEEDSRGTRASGRGREARGLLLRAAGQVLGLGSRRQPLGDLQRDRGCPGDSRGRMRPERLLRRAGSERLMDDVRRTTDDEIA